MSPAKSSDAGSTALPVPERLLAAAMELIRTRGLQGMSQARVAAAAGLRQSHLTYYFPTRKELIKALVEHIHAELTAEMDALMREEQPPSIARVRDFFTRRSREPLLARLMLALMNAADEDPSLRRWLVDFDHDLIRRLGAIFRELGLDPGEDDLVLLHAGFVGLAIMSAHDAGDSGRARAARLSGLAFDRLVGAASADGVERLERPPGGVR